MSELHYGVNVENLLHELSQYESEDIGEFDVYGEDESGREGAATIDITLLASDAFSLIAELKAQRDALAAENAYLLPKAASELSNAWVLHKYWVGIHAALMHMKVGRIYDAEQWLQNTIAGPGIEAPNFKLTEEIEAWATEQSKDSISHSRALEILTTQTPATNTYLNSVRAEGAISVRNAIVIADDGTDLYELATEVAAQLRAGEPS